MKESKWVRLKEQILVLPLLVMMVFAVIHSEKFISFSLLGKNITLGLTNKIVSLAMVCILYIWALFINKKRMIRVTALVMASLSFCGIIISLEDMGSSINDLLFAGTSILALFYVFENGEYLLQKIREYDKFLTFGIWLFAGYSVILFLFFPNYQTQWGEGTYFFGHRYASVCSLAIMLIGLKLTNKPKRVWPYWVLMLLLYYACFWTGARVYMISNLAQLYAMLFVFRKDSKRFLVSCVAITLAAILAFFSASSFNKVEKIITDTGNRLEQMDDAVEIDETYEWVNSISNGRWQMWERCINAYNRLPVFNKLVGSGNKYVYDNNEGIYAHVDFINILHFNGLLGLVTYLFAFVGYVPFYWRRNHLSIILLIGFWGVWFVLAVLNGYGNYMADMMSLPYMSVLAHWEKARAERGKM